MELPIYIDGKREGGLTVERRGAATVMTAELRDVGRLVRLTVYGEKAGYLGVPEPDGDRLRLVRRFSPAEMRRFPQQPVYAAERPLDGPPPPPENEEPPSGQGRHVLWMGGKPHYF